MDKGFIHPEQAYHNLIKNKALSYWYYPEVDRCMLLQAPSMRFQNKLPELSLICLSDHFNDYNRVIYQNIGSGIPSYEFCALNDYVDIDDSREHVLNYIYFMEFLQNFNPGERVIIHAQNKMAEILSLLRGYSVAVHLVDECFRNILCDYSAFEIGGLNANFIVHDVLFEDGKKQVYPNDYLSAQDLKPSNIHKGHLELKLKR